MISLTINAIPKNKHKIFFHYYLFVPEQASFDLFVLYSKLQQGQLLPPPPPPLAAPSRRHEPLRSGHPGFLLAYCTRVCYENRGNNSSTAAPTA